MSLESVPKDLRNLRACLLCSMIKVFYIFLAVTPLSLISVLILIFTDIEFFGSKVSYKKTFEAFLLLIYNKHLQNAVTNIVR